MFVYYAKTLWAAKQSFVVQNNDNQNLFYSVLKEMTL